MRLSGNFKKPLHNSINYPPAASDEVIRSILHRTANESVVFKHQFPPLFPITSLTYFGGRPTVSPDFVWPRSPKGTPYTFLAQVACIELPDFQLRSELPADGVLHFFTNWDIFEGFDNAETWPNHVVYSHDKHGKWYVADEPADLPSCYGHNASYYFPWLSRMDRQLCDYPNAFPKKAMTMGVVRTFSEEHPHQADGNSAGRYQELWEEEQAAELRRVYGEPVSKPTLPSPEDRLNDRILQRPTTTFPALWIDVEIFCGLFLKELLGRGMQTLTSGKNASGHPWPANAESVRAGYEDGVAKANSAIAKAHACGLMKRVPDTERTAFWGWLEGMNATAIDGLTDRRAAYTLNQLLWSAVRSAGFISIAAGEKSASLVPEELMGELHMQHSVLVGENYRRPAGRHQMLGNGRNVQGAPDRQASNVMLLQLDTDYPMQWMFGDCGVLQYWITWDDLRAGRFDRVRITLEGH